MEWFPNIPPQCVGFVARPLILKRAKPTRMEGLCMRIAKCSEDGVGEGSTYGNTGKAYAIENLEVDIAKRNERALEAAVRAGSD